MPVNRPYQLVIDQGGQSTRVIVFDQDGQTLFQQSSATPKALNKALHQNARGPQSPATEFFEYAPQPFVESCRQVLEDLHQQWSDPQSLYSLDKISSVSIIAQRSSIIACDKHTGQAITPMISWQDTRNHHWLSQQQFSRAQMAEFQHLSGLRLNAHAGVSKMRWLIENDPLVQQKLQSDQLVFMPWGAYFLQCLSGGWQAITDPILASRTYLTEYNSLDWSPLLLEHFGILKHCLPRIVPSQHDYGELSVGAHRFPIRLLGGDQNFVSYAYGRDNLTDNIFLNIGTGAFIQAACDTTGLTTHLLKTVPAIEQDKPSIDLLEGTINAAASAIEWAQTEMEVGYSHDELNQLLKNTLDPPVFINTLSGLGSPYWIEKRPSQFLTLPGSPPDQPLSSAQKMQAVIESVLFLCVINARELLKHNSSITKIIVSGGLANMDNFCQHLANILSLPVSRYQDMEASARGVVFYRSGYLSYQPVGGKKTVFVPLNKLKGQLEGLNKRLSLFEKTIAALAN